MLSKQSFLIYLKHLSYSTFSFRICNSFGSNYFIRHSSHLVSVRIPFSWFSSQLPGSLRYLAETSLVVLSPLFLNIQKLETDIPPWDFYRCHLLMLKFIKDVFHSSFEKKMFLIHSITINTSQSSRHGLKEPFLQFLRYHSFCSKQQCFSTHFLEFSVQGMHSTEKQTWNHQFTIFSADHSTALALAFSIDPATCENFHGRSTWYIYKEKEKPRFIQILCPGIL